MTITAFAFCDYFQLFAPLLRTEGAYRHHILKCYIYNLIAFSHLF